MNERHILCELKYLTSLIGKSLLAPRLGNIISNEEFLITTIEILQWCCIKLFYHESSEKRVNTYV